MAETVLEVDSVDTALAIFGNCDENIRLLEQAFGVTAICRGTEVKLTGGEEDVERARRALDAMLMLRAGGTPLEEQTVRYCISLAGSGDEARVKDLTGDFIAITAKGRPVRPKTLGQKAYIGAIVKNAVTFGVGPAGTGKTYLAVAMAVKAFKAREVSRIILTRPAVEAGEKLGFLPGDLQNKVDPYLRPLYDALFDMLGAENYQKLLEKQLIEVAPLAYMRGRTLDDAFIILDEAQNIKNPNTITARSVRSIKARMRLCLSGTPIENNLFELWSLFEFLMPGFLGSQHAFQRGVVKPIRDGDGESLEYLRSRVKPFILRRTKAEVAKDLPPKIESVTYCNMTDEQAELYTALTRKLRDQVLADVESKGMAKSQMSILDALLKLRQICCHPRLLKVDMPGFSTGSLPSGKFEAFKDMIFDVVEGGHKVLVFSQFVQMLQIIRGWLQLTDIPFCYLDGTSKDRLDQVDRFNNSPEIPIFLISLKAGGTGINLTSADYVIHYDPWWNPAVESQATDRTHRIGQTRQVFSYKLICQNTVEEKILKLQEMKRGVAEAVIPGQDTWKSLTKEDLEMLFEV